MITSIYFIKTYFEKDKDRILNISLSFLFAALSMLACFVMINYYCALLVLFLVYNYLEIRRKQSLFSKRNFVWTAIIIGLISIPSLGYTLKMLFKLKTNNLFVFGGEKGFVADTVMSVCNSVVYPFHPNELTGTILACFCGIVFFVSCFLTIKDLKISSNGSNHFRFFSFITILLVIIILIIITQHYLFGVKYVVDRVAMYMFVIFLFMTVYLGSYLADIYKNGRFLIYGLAGFSMIQWFVSFNFTHVYQWEPQADVKQAMKDLGKFNKSNQKQVLLPCWYYSSTVQFYQYLYRYQWLDVDDMNRVDFTQDLYYFPDEAMNSFKGHSMTVLASYPETQSYLLRNNDICKTAILESRDENLKLQMVSPGGYSPAIVFAAEKYQGMNDLRILAESDVNFPDATTSGQMAVSVYDSTGKVIEWHARNFNSDLYVFHNDWCTTDFTAYLGKIPSNASQIKVYIWNNGNNALLTRKIQAKLSQIERH